MHTVIYQGSFAPFTDGHLAAINSVLTYYANDAKVIIVPVHSKYKKDSLLNYSDEERLKCIRDTTHKLHNVEISTYEIDQPCVLNSSDVLLHFKSIYKNVVAMYGDDIWHNMYDAMIGNVSNWPHESVVSLISLNIVYVCMVRGVKTLYDKAVTYWSQSIDNFIILYSESTLSSTEIRANQT